MSIVLIKHITPSTYYNSWKNEQEYNTILQELLKQSNFVIVESYSNFIVIHDNKQDSQPPILSAGNVTIPTCKLLITRI